MDVSDVKNQIKQKRIDPYYIFTGPEWEVQKQYIYMIAKVLNAEVKRIDSISDVYGKVRSISMLGKRFCYVVRDDKELIMYPELQDQLGRLMSNGNVLIHIITSIDKRTKFYKLYKNKIVEFDPLKPQVLKKYIQKEIPLSDRNCQMLIDICENDYGRILLEIDKIYQFSNYYMRMPIAPIDYNEVFDLLVKDGTIYEPPYDAVFDFVDSVLKRKVNRSFDLLQQSYDSGEATLVLLSVLYNNAKALLQVQSCESNDIAKVTGLTGWQIKNAIDKKGKYTNGELVRLLRIIQKVESGIKTGTIDEKIAMEYVLVNVL